jgi:murein DD-endopeptidase MepM/ murein hydrolase activator NlpD
VPKPRPKPDAIRRAAAEAEQERRNQAARRQVASRRPDNVPSPPPRESSRFAWPLRGEIISDFGPQDGGLHNDGINIAARRGTPVSAAANGVVAYVGNELRGFGNLVLLKHTDGWITAYAHLDTILVQRGAQVRRGDRIGRVGSSGSVSRPQLHFETRRGSDAVNPRNVLTAQTAALAGR